MSQELLFLVHLQVMKSGKVFFAFNVSDGTFFQANQGGTNDFYKCSDNSNCADRACQALRDSRKWELERRASLG